MVYEIALNYQFCTIFTRKYYCKVLFKQIHSFLVFNLCC